MSKYLNIAAYKFVRFEEATLQQICKVLKDAASKQGLKGTILLSLEGINLFLAGEETGIQIFQQYLESVPGLNNLSYKNSYSSFVPFKKLHVKIRKEIVTFAQPDIQPENFTAPYISPKELESWLEQNKDVVLLDTRNEFEYEIGAFNDAVHLHIDNFREFPSAIANVAIDKCKPVVTYCTGGIRCEKAAAYLLEQGFKEVYQLEGGILNYFEQCGNKFYRGDCFVFDDRMILNSDLEPIAAISDQL